MCGFAAAYHYASGPVDAERLLAVRDHMAARGPDGAGLWTSEDGRAALAHRRLSIIDLSEAGAQPMASADGRRVLSFNGEIYNYQALRAELEAKGFSFRSHSDTEVLLHLWADLGPRMVEAIRGMFALALWDEAEQGLFLARDPYGIKPLYIADDGRRLWAASQVRALLQAGHIDTEPDPAGHAGFFLWGHVPEPHTLFRGIRALPAGHTLWVDRDGAREPYQYASVTEALAEGERQDLQLSPEEAQGRLREALCDSVRHHLIADVPVGVFLSAGLDSTTLAALADEQGGTLRTVTLGFEEYAGTADDEAPLAEAVARHYGAEHRTVTVSRADFEAEYPRLLASMDQPSIDGLNTYFVSQAAVRAGLKVSLSGVGGDELFGGYPSFREIPRVVGLVGAVPGAATIGRGFRQVAAPVIGRMTSPKYAGLLEYGHDWGGAYLLRRGFYMPWELPEVMDPEMARTGLEALQTRARLDETIGGLKQDRSRVSAMESTWYMRSQLLRDTDWASMAHSLEVRTPLVDWRLLQQLAPVLAAQPGLSKADMGRTPARPLPPALLDRPKTGFTTPVRRWMLEAGAVSERDRGLRGLARHLYAAYRSATA